MAAKEAATKLLPCVGGQSPAEPPAVASPGSNKAGEAAVAGGPSAEAPAAKPAASAVADDATLVSAAEAADGDAPPAGPGSDPGSDSEAEVNWVEMPVEHVRWVLSRKRGTDPVPSLEEFGIHTEEDLDTKDPDMLIRRTIASLQYSQDDFFEYQAWVREVFEANGRVMVPEGVLGPKDRLQQAIDEDWYGVDADSDARDAHLNAGGADSIGTEETPLSK